MASKLTPWPVLQARWQQVQQTPHGQPLVSPCVSVCTIHEDIDVCQGCLRTIEEIARWGMSTPVQQRAIWQRLGDFIQAHQDQA